MNISQIILAITCLTQGHKAAAASDVFFLETTMTGTKEIKIRHQGLCFEDTNSSIECHYTPEGLKICDKRCYFQEGKKGKYLNRQLLMRGHSSSVERNKNWCKNWAKNKSYCVLGYDCWTMVYDYCTSHGLPCPVTEDTNAARNLLGVSGTIRGLTDGCKALEKGQIPKGVACLVTAPLRGGSEALNTATTGLNKTCMKLKKKWKL